MRKQLGASLAVLVLSFVARAQVCSVPICPVPQHEQCIVNPNRVPDTEFQNCLTRNRQEDARYHQCFNQRLRECERERQEQERQEREKFCRQHPDSSECK